MNLKESGVGVSEVPVKTTVFPDKVLGRSPLAIAVEPSFRVPSLGSVETIYVRVVVSASLPVNVIVIGVCSVASID